MISNEVYDWGSMICSCTFAIALTYSVVMGFIERKQLMKPFMSGIFFIFITGITILNFLKTFYAIAGIALYQSLCYLLILFQFFIFK